MKKKKLQLKNLQVKSFVTKGHSGMADTVKGGGFLSIFGNTCAGGCASYDKCSQWSCNANASGCTCTGCKTNEAIPCITDEPCFTGETETTCP